MLIDILIIIFLLNKNKKKIQFSIDEISCTGATVFVGIFSVKLATVIITSKVLIRSVQMAFLLVSFTVIKPIYHVFVKSGII